MTYLQERKQLLKDIHADGGVNYELEEEIKGLEDIHDTFDRFMKVLGKHQEPPNSCACGGLKIHESDYCKDCV